MEKSIRVHVMGRDYRLLVREEDETVTREIAAYVNAKMMAFRKVHPEQPELTTAVIAALALAEELFAAWDERDGVLDGVDDAADALATRLDEALRSAPSPGTAGDAPLPGPDPGGVLD